MTVYTPRWKNTQCMLGPLVVTNHQVPHDGSWREIQLTHWKLMVDELHREG